MNLFLEPANWKQVKLMVVGEEGVGKTSVIASFKNKSNKLDKSSKNISTNGIAMSDWKVNNTKVYSKYPRKC